MVYDSHCKHPAVPVESRVEKNFEHERQTPLQEVQRQCRSGFLDCSVCRCPLPVLLHAGYSYWTSCEGPIADNVTDVSTSSHRVKGMLVQ